MLTELRIRNLAVVEDAAIPFAPGLNVMTGSTGAGKSIVLAAIELLSGARGRRSLIRAGAPALSVEGTFVLDARSPLRERFGLAAHETTLAVRRELGADGRSRIWINGEAAGVAAAQEAARALLELHGQHRQQEYLDPESHVLYLDAWGDYGDLLAGAMAAIEGYVSASRRVRDLAAAEEGHRRQEDYLRFQLRELEELRLEPGLEERLESRVKRIEHRQRYAAALEEAVGHLEGEDGSAIERLARAARALEGLAAIDPAWRDTAAELSGMKASIREAARRIASARASLEDDGEDVEKLQERLAAIQRASRKHGLDAAGLMARRDELRTVLRSLDGGPAEIEDARREREVRRRALEPLLARLSGRRAKSAAALGALVTGELAKLGMKGAQFEARVEPLENNAFQEAGVEIHLSPRGADRVVFMIRTNVGEAMHPLAEIVSGGELSRIALILKQLQVEERRIPTLIFDEIDAGLGADLGGVVAERLAGLARTYQIVCITHLPQVAARAAHHIRVSKRVKGERTIASAAVLAGEDRVAEIARMLGGDGRLRRELAVEMLDKGTVRP